MANTIKEQRIIDSNKRALIKYVILSDGTQESNTVLVDASTLAFALNTNGFIMSSNTDPKPNYRNAIKRIWSSGKNTGTIRLKWQGDANSEIVILGTGTSDIGFEYVGGLITNPEANATGDILISTLGMANGDAMTIMLELKKDSLDYDAGQTADPYAFNRRPL
jgi:hypothetical protein